MNVQEFAEKKKLVAECAKAFRDALTNTIVPSRELSLALTKLDECELWVGRVFDCVEADLGNTVKR